MPETTPLIKAALNLRVGAGFDVYHIKPLSLYSKLVLSNDSLTANTHERLVILLKNNQKDLHVLQALIGLIN